MTLNQDMTLASADHSTAPAGNGQPVDTLGTDLGTGNTAQVIGTNHTFDLVTHAGSPYVPTALFLVDRQTEEALIGDPAYNAGTKDASSLYLKAKRSYLQDPHTPLNGKGLLPAEVLRLFVKKLVKSLRQSVPWLDDPSRQVRSAVAYPTGLTLKQQAEFRQLLEEAGLPVTTLVPEAVAAALTFLDSGQLNRAGQKVAIFDVGDGTTDTAVLAYDGRQLDLLIGPRGDSAFGAHNFNGAVYERFLSQVRLKGSIFDPVTGLNLGHESVPAQQRRFHLELYRTATSAVRELSYQATTNQVLSGPKGKLFELSLTQDEFRELAAPLGQTLAHAVTDTLAGSDLRWDQIDTCLLVGGGSLICGVRETVAQAVGRAVDEIHVSSCPLEVVARGAALFAALDGQRQGDPLPGGVGFLLAERSAGIERTVAKMHVSAGGSVIPRGGLTVESTRQYVEATGGPLVLNVEFVEARPGIQCPVPEGGVAYLEPEQVESIGSASIDISDLPAGTHECLFGFDVDRSGRLGFRLCFLGQVGQEVRCGTIGADGTGSHAIGRHMAVAVVLDISGSMREVSPSTDNTKLTDAQAAICELARHAGGYENVDVALVAFNDAAQVVVPFGHPPDRIDAAVAAMQAHGGTHMQTGLAAAAELLAAYPNSRRIVVFVTDGRPASAVAAAEEAARLREHCGIEIVCIAIGDDALVPFLAAQIASDPASVHAGQDIDELFTTVKQTHLFTQDANDKDTDDEDTDGETPREDDTNRKRKENS